MQGLEILNVEFGPLAEPDAVTTSSRVAKGLEKEARRCLSAFLRWDDESERRAPPRCAEM
jgi:hypothetical protein